jgi:zinc transport system ATP-binding protein
MTIVMVSHEVHLVADVANQVICVNKTLLCSGTPQETLSTDMIKELYGHEVSLYKHTH